jgi:hypothetical protein
LQNKQSASYLALLRQAEMEGWLSKRGDRGLIKSWKRRWFTLSGDTLTYYVEPPAEGKIAEKKGEIALAGCLKVRPGGGKEKPFELELVYDARVYRLAADDKATFGRWLAVLGARYSVT